MMFVASNKKESRIITANIIEYKNLIAFHPGSFLVDIVEDMGVSVEEFAERCETSPENMYAIINGEQKLTPDMARKISNATGTSAELWMGLQVDYDNKALEIELCEALEKGKQSRVDYINDLCNQRKEGSYGEEEKEKKQW